MRDLSGEGGDRGQGRAVRKPFSSTKCSARCPTQAINKGALAQYMTAMAKAIAFAGQTSTLCSCPCLGIGGLCRGGKCQAAFCGPPSADTLPACSDAGGICGYSANTTCNAMGPPDGCAYSDEVCCVN
jgi:hypothetical protein